MNGSGARAPSRKRHFSRAFAAASLLAASAHAGHAPLVPEPRTILLRDDHPEHVVVGTRRGGYFVTTDAGATWSWMCEAGVGYDDEDVYPGALLKSGTLVVSTGFGGIAASADGCGFAAWLPSEQPFVADVRRSPVASAAVLALEARAGGEAFVNRLWQSSDGFTWQALGVPFAPEVLASSFAVSNEGELYAGVSGPSGAELWHSADLGQNWQESQVTAESGVTLRIIGASGSGDAARVFVIVDYAQAEGLTVSGDRALASVDGGQTFFTLLQATGDLSSWSLSNDGSRLAVGGHDDGIFVLEDAQNTTNTSVLPRVSSRPVHALAWGGDARLYAAGHEASDGFSVGVSADAGRTFEPLFALCQVQGPLACAADTSVGSQCHSSGETGWDVRKEVASTAACTPPSPQGTPNEPVTPEGSTPEANGDAPAVMNDTPTAGTAGAGCSLSAAGSSGRASLLLLLLAFRARRSLSTLRLRACHTRRA